MKFQFIGLMLLAIPASAGEYAVLSNGFRIHADRHESESGTVTLYEGEGVTKLPAASIARFETEENAPTPAPPVPAAPAIPAPAAAVPITPEQLAKAAAEKYHLPESFVRSVMKVESNLHQEALSPKGAIGLMQLMPDTARTLGVNPKNSKENAEGGAQYLRDLLARYENRPDQVLLALAAYNAGPGAVEKYHGVPPYNETRRYILRVLRYWDQTQKAK
jgi:soluble lytic murein transglycosylase-like protein